MTAAPSPEAAPDPTAQERVEWLGKNSKRLIIALIVIIIAGLIVAFSFSLFNSSSANPGNSVASGIMTMDNSDDGLAILTVEKLLPGESGTGTVTITNVGDADGDFTLTPSNLEDTPGEGASPADPPFSTQLTIAITDDNGQTVYNGLLSAIGTDAFQLGTWPNGATHEYTFTVTFDEESGNAYQGATSTVDFIWNATQSS